MTPVGLDGRVAQLHPWSMNAGCCYLFALQFFELLGQQPGELKDCYVSQLLQWSTAVSTSWWGYSHPASMMTVLAILEEMCSLSWGQHGKP